MIKFTNNAFGTLSAGILAADTSISLTAGHGARFPTTSGNDYFYSTLVDSSLNLEVVKCTTRAVDTLTVVRAQDGFAARDYPSGSRLELRLCNAYLKALAQEAATAITIGGTDTYTGTLDPAPEGYNDNQIYFGRVTNANTVSNPTLNLNSFGAKTIKRLDGAAAQIGDLAAGHVAFFAYNGTDMLLMNPMKPQAASVGAVHLASSSLGQHVTMINGTLVHSRAGSAETIAIETLAGADPTAADPVLFLFRNATVSTGDFAVLTLTAAHSLTISSGSTLATVNNEAFRLWFVMFNDGGTLRLGVVRATAGSNAVAWSHMSLKGWGIASSTAEGGAGAADSAQVIYTGTAVTSKAYVIIGYSTWESGLAAVGTWNTAPSRVQLFGGGTPAPGERVQYVRERDAAMATATTDTVDDDTIPTSTEGDEYVDAVITPTSSSNVIEAHWFLGYLSSDGSAFTAQASLFNGTTNLGSMSDRAPTVNEPVSFHVHAQFLAGGTSAITVDGRAGTDQAGANVTYNGALGARKLGGSLGSFIELSEIMA